MKYNKEYTGEKYREIALVLGIKGAAEMSLEDVREAACGEIDRLSKAVGIPETISELGVKKQIFQQLQKMLCEMYAHQEIQEKRQ